MVHWIICLRVILFYFQYNTCDQFGWREIQPFSSKSEKLKLKHVHKSIDILKIDQAQTSVIYLIQNPVLFNNESLITFILNLARTYYNTSQLQINWCSNYTIELRLRTCDLNILIQMEKFLGCVFWWEKIKWNFTEIEDFLICRYQLSLLRFSTYKF